MYFFVHIQQKRQIVHYYTEVWSEETQQVGDLQVQVEDKDLQMHKLSLLTSLFCTGKIFFTTKGK